MLQRESCIPSCSSSRAQPAQPLWLPRANVAGVVARAPRAGLPQRLILRALRGFNGEDDDYPVEFPTKFELMQRPDKQKPLVRVRLTVHYRVHSRQILCIGGSQIPMGWSFLSIAKVPMTWNSGDIWTCEVELQAGQRIEHKYVILEEQDWAPIVNEDAQGVVDISYRTGTEPGRPPDLQVIQKQMAIVAWQPGPNRILQVPTEEEIAQLQPGDMIQRTPPRPAQRTPSGGGGTRIDPFEGTWEVLTLDEQGRPFLDRHDVWGWIPTAGARPADNLKGFNFVQPQ